MPPLVPRVTGIRIPADDFITPALSTTPPNVPAAPAAAAHAAYADADADTDAHVDAHVDNAAAAAAAAAAAIVKRARPCRVHCCHAGTMFLAY